MEKLAPQMELLLCLSFSAIFGISHCRITNACQMGSDLMGLSGDQMNLKQSVWPSQNTTCSG